MPVLYIVLSKQRFVLYEFLAYPGRYIYPDNVHDKDEKYYRICSNHIDGSIKIFLLKTTILTASCTIAAMWPSYQSISREIKTTAMELRLPHVDKNSYAEFFSNIILECNILGHGFLGYFSIEVGMDIISDFVTISQKLLKYRLKKLFTQDRKSPSVDVITELRKIVQHLEEFNGYALILIMLQNVSKIIKIHMLSSFFSNSWRIIFRQICSLFGRIILLAKFFHTTTIHLFDRNGNIHTIYGNFVSIVCKNESCFQMKLMRIFSFC